MIPETIKKVLSNVVQHFTESEKALARSNIGAAAVEDIPTDAVKYTEQALTDAQRGQARQNINAAANVLASQSSNGLMSSGDKEKLDGIQAGAEANVQADWTEASSSSDAYIKNKPALAAIATSGSWNDLQNIPSGLVLDSLYVHTDNNFTDTLKSKLDGIEAGATKILIPNDPSQPQPLTLDSYNLHFHWGSGLSCYTPTGGAPQLIVDPTITTKLAGIEAGAQVNVQSDWNQTDNTADDFIKNKPTDFVQDASYVHTDNNFTNTLKDKLDGIESGAEVNDVNDVQVNGVSVVTNKVANIVLPTPATEVYLAEYGTATVAEISAAKNAGKLVYTLIPGTYYPTVAYLRETTRNGASANFASPSGDSGSFKIASVDSNGDWSNETLNLAKASDLSPNKVVFVTTSDTHATVDGYRQAGYEVILRYDSAGNDLHQYFRLSQYNPDGSMEFTCVRSGSGYVISYKYGLSTNDQWTRTDTSVSNYTGIQIDGVGRNLHLNQNNYVQTNFPGGLWDADMAQDNIFRRLGGFSGAFYLAARYKTDGTYELGLSYSGSGTYGTITFIGTETVIATDNTVTVKQAAYIAETEYYTVSTRFGGSASTPFDPTRHKAIYYSGFGNIGPASDVKIAIWNDSGTIKIGMTSIEVGKVGATN